jgi:hypothetical protein
MFRTTSEVANSPVEMVSSLVTGRSSHPQTHSPS